MNCEQSSEEDTGTISPYSTASEGEQKVSAMSSREQAIFGSGSLCTEQEGRSEVYICMHGGNGCGG